MISLSVFFSFFFCISLQSLMSIFYLKCFALKALISKLEGSSKMSDSVLNRNCNGNGVLNFTFVQRIPCSMNSFQGSKAAKN